MNLAGLHGRLRPSRAGVRLRILAGLAVLLVAGLTASSVTSILMLESFLHKRNTRTLRDTSARLQAVIARGPQVADGDQISALLGPPFGSIAIDAHDRILLSTGSGDLAPEALVRATTTVPAAASSTTATSRDGTTSVPSAFPAPASSWRERAGLPSGRQPSSW
ncbi:hypothetical protein ACFQ10_17420 [Streptomyces indonesiensis]